MSEYSNGERIKARIDDDEWVDAIYIGPDYFIDGTEDYGYHVVAYCTDDGEYAWAGIPTEDMRHL